MRWTSNASEKRRRWKQKRHALRGRAKEVEEAKADEQAQAVSLQ